MIAHRSVEHIPHTRHTPRRPAPLHLGAQGLPGSLLPAAQREKPVPHRLCSGEAEIHRGVCGELKECQRPAGEEVRQAGPAAGGGGEEEGREAEPSRSEPAVAALGGALFGAGRRRVLQGGVVPAPRSPGISAATGRSPAAADVPEPAPQPACPPWEERPPLWSQDLLCFLVQKELARK